MDTALNIANISPDPAPRLGRPEAAIDGRRDKVKLETGEQQSRESEPDSDSSFARVLESESTPAKETGKAETEPSETAGTATGESGKTSEESSQGAENLASGQSTQARPEQLAGLTLEPLGLAGELRPADDMPIDKPPLAAAEPPAGKPARQIPTQESGLQAAGTTTKADAVQQPASGHSSSKQQDLTRSLVNSTEDQAKLSTTSESCSAAGKALPPPGKGQPAGFFMNSGSDQKAFSRLGENLTQDTNPINLDERFVARMSPENKLVMESGGDKLLRSIVSAQSAAGSEAGLSGSPSGTVQPASQNPDASTVLNQFSLNGAGDRSLQAGRIANPASVDVPLNSPLSLSIAAEAGSTDFNSQLSSRIRWMGNMNLSSAELRLHPAELGSVEVRISTEDDQTRVSFITSNASAKEVIETSLPRLRELLGDNGLQLEQGDVTHRDQTPDERNQSMAGSGQADAEDIGQNDSQSVHIRRESRGQIDHYV